MGDIFITRSHEERLPLDAFMSPCFPEVNRRMAAWSPASSVQRQLSLDYRVSVIGRLIHERESPSRRTDEVADERTLHSGGATSKEDSEMPRNTLHQERPGRRRSGYVAKQTCEL